MKWSVTKVMCLIGGLNAIASMANNYLNSKHEYLWQLTTLLWIVCCFVMELRIDSLNKNK